MHTLPAAYFIGVMLQLIPPTKTHALAQQFVFHLTSAVWYFLRTSRNKKYLQSSEGLRVFPSPLFFGEKAWFALSCAAQYPLHTGAAAMFPFVCSCVLSLRSLTEGSNVALFVHTMFFGVAVLFLGMPLFVPVVTTTISLLGYGYTAYRADAASFALAAITHTIVAACCMFLHGMYDHFETPLTTEIFLASVVALLCCEARISAAATVRDTRWDVALTCRYAALFSVFIPLFSYHRQTPKEQIGNMAILAIALMMPWFAMFHCEWRKDVPTPSLPFLSPLGYTLVIVAIIALIYRYIYLKH